MRAASVADTMFFVRSYVGDRARAEIGALPVDGYLQRAFADEEGLLMRVTVRWVGHCARRQVGFMQSHSEPFVRLPLKHRSKCILSGGLEWKAFKAVNLRRQNRGVRTASL